MNFTQECLFKKNERILFNPHAFYCPAPKDVPPGEHVVIEIRDAKHLVGSSGWSIKTNRHPNIWLDQGWFVKSNEAGRIKIMPEEDRKFNIMVKTAEKRLPELKRQFKQEHNALIDSLFS